MSKFIRLGAAWKSKGKGWSGKLNNDAIINPGDKFMIFENTKKDKENQPDLVIGIFDDSEDK